jgi:curved DNA-binding protein CbpA
MSNHYSTLNIASNASEAEIRTAYKKLALQWHPDKNKNKTLAQENFIKIQAAYETLSDATLKAQYDLKYNIKADNYANYYYNYQNLYQDETPSYEDKTVKSELFEAFKNKDFAKAHTLIKEGLQFGIDDFFIYGKYFVPSSTTELIHILKDAVINQEITYQELSAALPIETFNKIFKTLLWKEFKEAFDSAFIIAYELNNLTEVQNYINAELSKISTHKISLLSYAIKFDNMDAAHKLIEQGFHLYRQDFNAGGLESKFEYYLSKSEFTGEELNKMLPKEVINHLPIGNFVYQINLLKVLLELGGSANRLADSFIDNTGFTADHVNLNEIKNLVFKYEGHFTKDYFNKLVPALYADGYNNFKKYLFSNEFTPEQINKLFVEFTDEDVIAKEIICEYNFLVGQTNHPINCDDIGYII